MKNSGFSILCCSASCEAEVDIAAKSVSFSEDVVSFSEDVSTFAIPANSVNLKDEELVNLSQCLYGN